MQQGEAKGEDQHQYLGRRRRLEEHRPTPILKGSVSLLPQLVQDMERHQLPDSSDLDTSGTATTKHSRHESHVSFSESNDMATYWHGHSPLHLRHSLDMGRHSCSVDMKRTCSSKRLQSRKARLRNARHQRSGSVSADWQPPGACSISNDGNKSSSGLAERRRQSSRAFRRRRSRMDSSEFN